MSEAVASGSDQVTVAPAGGGGLRRLLRRFRYPIAVALASRVAVYLLIAGVGWTSRVPHASSASYQAFFSPLALWDSAWYHRIALHWYDPAVSHGNNAAFLPLFPAIWRALMLLPGPDTWPASVFSTACFVVALVLFHELGERLVGPVEARRATLLLAVFPLSFVYSMPYAESLFLLLSVAAFLLVERGQMTAASVVGAVSVLTRPIGLLLVPALAWRLWARGERRIEAYAPLALMPAVQLLFSLALWWRTGNLFATSTAERLGWGRTIDFPPTFIAHAIVKDVIGDGRVRTLLDIGFTLMWFALLVVLVRMRNRVGLDYSIYSGLAVLVPVATGSLLSMGRLGMIAFPLFWALARVCDRESRLAVVLAASGALMGMLVFITYGTQTYIP
jgi:Gpi18-like mannosyltransferase